VTCGDAAVEHEQGEPPVVEIPSDQPIGPSLPLGHQRPQHHHGILLEARGDAASEHQHGELCVGLEVGDDHARQTGSSLGMVPRPRQRSDDGAVHVATALHAVALQSLQHLGSLQDFAFRLVAVHHVVIRFLARGQAEGPHGRQHPLGKQVAARPHVAARARERVVCRSLWGDALPSHVLKHTLRP